MVMKMKEEFISIGKAARYLGMRIEGLRKVEDLIAITTSFSARIYGKRGGKELVDAVTTVLQDPVKEGEQP